MMKKFAKNTSFNLVGKQSAKQQKGAILLEALIAILIFSFGILAISGLQGAMVKNTTDSNYRAEASYIVQQYVGRMWTDPNNLASYVGANNAYAARLPAGTFNVTQTPGTKRFQFVVTWTTPGQAQHNFTSNASIDAN